MHITTILGSVSIGYIAYNLVRLRNNWRTAKSFNLPIVVTPIDQYGPIWMLFAKPLLPLFQWLPEPLSTFCRVTWMGWEYADKGKIHQELGPAFVIVGADRNEIVLSEPSSIHEVLSKPKVFRKPKLYELHSLFGRNVNTTNDEEWARHRKVTTPCFNERVSRTVWDESCSQAQSMLEQVLASNPESAYTELISDTKIIALHVLMSAGLGVSQPFSGGVREPGHGHLMSFGHALFHLVENIFLTLLFGPLFDPQRLHFLPKSIKDVCIATNECKTYFDEMIEEQRTAESKISGKARSNLVGSLVKASEQADEEKTRGHGAGGLTKNEIRGNLYIFTFAGHETTANAMAYAVSLLTAYPKWQDWLAEEVDAISAGNDHLAYEEIYPRLRRCQALMYESLRLYPPVPWIPREASSDVGPILLSLQNSKAPFIVPPNTYVHLNMYARQVSTEIWGPDALEFRPDRFIIPPTATVPEGWIEQGITQGNEERLVAPPSSQFSVWSLGPRVCPGMKFSQVEFVAAIFTFFSQAKVYPADVKAGPVTNSQQSDDLHKRLQRTIADSAFRGSTLSIKHPQDVCLRWKVRK